jgi:hypothetical protein
MCVKYSLLSFGETFIFGCVSFCWLNLTEAEIQPYATDKTKIMKAISILSHEGLNPDELRGVDDD